MSGADAMSSVWIQHLLSAAPAGVLERARQVLPGMLDEEKRLRSQESSSLNRSGALREAF